MIDRLSGSGVTYINIPNLQRETRIPRASTVNQTTALTAEVVRHAVAAQNGLGPVLEAWFEDLESFFRVGDVVVVAEAVAGEVVFVGAVASELNRVRLVIVSLWVVGGVMRRGFTLKLGSVSQEMRLPPQRHFASVYTIVESSDRAKE